MPQRKHIVFACLVWSLLATLSAGLTISGGYRNMLEQFRATADMAFQKELNFRRWNSMRGGVYVKVSEGNQPNPYLDVPDRDLRTVTGINLTMINPAYMTRQAHELQQESSGVQGHITSLKPIRPGNAPDPWEQAALESFERGTSEVQSLFTPEGRELFRFMRPMTTEKSCLKCHAKQGYAEGDIRGGISVTLPVEAQFTAFRSFAAKTALGHGIVWLFGMAVAMFAGTRLIRSSQNEHQARKKAEVALEQLGVSENYYRALFTAVNDPVLVADRDTGILVECNEAAVRYFGRSREQLIGSPQFELYSLEPPQVEGMTEDFKRVMIGPRHTEEWRLLAAGGELRYAEVTASSFEVRERRLILGVFRDVTERKQTQEALARTEALHRAMLLNLPFDFWARDTSQRMIMQSEESIRMWGDLSTTVITDTQVESEYLSSWMTINARVLHGELDVRECAYTGPEGDLRQYHAIVAPIRHDAEILGILGINIDITERKQAEDALRESELRFKTLHNASFGGITIHEKGRILECNQGLSDISGYAYEELIGMDGLLLIAEQSRELVMANILSGYEKPYEAYGLRKNGEVYPLRLEARNIPYQGRTVRVVEFRDITESRLAQQALEQEALRRRILMEKSLDGIVIIDQEHRVVEANERFASMLGYSQEEVVGLYTWDYEAVASEADIRTNFSDLSEVSCAFETHHRRKDGSLFDVEVSLSGASVAGKPLMFAVCRDITDRKRVEDELRNANKRLTALWSISSLANADFTTICDHILHMIVEMTGSRFGFYGFVNKAESEMTIHSCSGEAMEGCTVLEKPSHFLIRHAGVWGEAVRKRRPFILNDYSEAHPAKKGCPSGHVQLENLLVVPFFSAGRIISVAAVANRLLPYTLEDVEQITSFLTGTQAIVERMQALEELTRAKNAAESANRAKSEFLANMSHEIRTPLNGVLGMLQLIQTSDALADVDSYAEMGIRAGQRLTSLLNDILDLARIEAGRMPIVSKPFAMADIFTALAETFSPMHYSKPISLVISASPDLPADVVGDEIRVRQILFNLVGNAMKFTGKGEVRVEVSKLLPSPSGLARLLFTVSDTGPGIPDEMIGQICAPFVQAASDFTRSHQGAGLGLSIARKLIDAMGGTLTFDSMEGQGTSVYLMLPLGIPEDSATAATPEPMRDAEAGASLRLLMVEDEEISRLSARLHLEKLGHKVDTASNGEEALEALRAEKYDCVLMDIQMDVMDGLAATRAIRSGASGVLDAQVPIVAMTAYAMSGDREKFLEAGMDDYVAKPVQVAELKRALGRVMNKDHDQSSR